MCLSSLLTCRGWHRIRISKFSLLSVRVRSPVVSLSARYMRSLMLELLSTMPRCASPSHLCHPPRLLSTSLSLSSSSIVFLPSFWWHSHLSVAIATKVFSTSRHNHRPTPEAGYTAYAAVRHYDLDHEGDSTEEQATCLPAFRFWCDTFNSLYPTPHPVLHLSV